MEFINFLDKTEIEIIKIVEKVGYSIEENTPLCLNNAKFKGFLKNKEKTIIICTENAKKISGYTLLMKNNIDTFERTARLIKKSIRHEAAHVVQECNNGNLIKINKKLSMHPLKLEALKGSMNISLVEEKEKQAYILEDKPKLLKNELIKYCL